MLDDGVPSTTNFGDAAACAGDSGGPLLAEVNERFVSRVTVLHLIVHC